MEITERILYVERKSSIFLLSPSEITINKGLFSEHSQSSMWSHQGMTISLRSQQFSTSWPIQFSFFVERNYKDFSLFIWWNTLIGVSVQAKESFFILHWEIVFHRRTRTCNWKMNFDVQQIFDREVKEKSHFAFWQFNLLNYLVFLALEFTLYFADGQFMIKTEQKEWN